MKGRRLIGRLNQDDIPGQLTPRWYTLKHHDEQTRLWRSAARFNVVPAGRRSGKCVALGTKIALHNGMVLPVEDLLPGDLVWTLSERGKFEAMPVLKVHDNGEQPCITIETERRGITTTENHPFLLGANWVEAQYLRVGDELIVSHMFPAFTNRVAFETITSIKPAGIQPTKNLTVEDNHNFIANGFLTHNTEIVGKRKVVLAALNCHRKDLPFFYRPWPDPRFFIGAPTRDQAKRIYWHDLKTMIPNRFVVGRPNETQLMIQLVTGAQIWVVGMDRPERIEGPPWDGGVLDEYANMKKDVWTHHVRACLADRRGWCDFIGVPEGRNHYYELYKEAQARAAFSVEKRKAPQWDHFHWVSADILPTDEIEAAKADLDELSFQQEFEASFVNFTGRAYHAFTEKNNVGRLEYDPTRRIDFCFDFNVDPGVALVVQEQYLEQRVSNGPKEWGDGIINEVYIPQNSNTIRVVDKLIDLYPNHQAEIYCYGDYTGGARGSASIQGSDWELIKRRLWGYYGRDRIYIKVKPNPKERDRINAVNSRCLSMNKKVRLMVDPRTAPNVVKDFEGVTIIEGGIGEIDKRKNPDLSHLTDAYGYRTWTEYPLKKRYAPSGQKYHR